MVSKTPNLAQGRLFQFDVDALFQGKWVHNLQREKTPVHKRHARKDHLFQTGTTIHRVTVKGSFLGM